MSPLEYEGQPAASGGSLGRPRRRGLLTKTALSTCCSHMLQNKKDANEELATFQTWRNSIPWRSETKLVLGAFP